MEIHNSFCELYFTYWQVYFIFESKIYPQKMNEQRPNILYVDDEIENTNAFKASFRRFYNTFTASNLAEAKKIWKIMKLQFC